MSTCTYLVPYMVRPGGQTVILLGFRRTGPCAKTWTEIASDLDHHTMPSRQHITPQETAARAGHAAVMGLLGTAAQIQDMLSSDARVRTTDGVAYLLRIRPDAEGVVDMYNNLARYMLSAFTKDADKSLLHCPPPLLAFSMMKWIAVDDLKCRVQFAGASTAARAVFAPDARQSRIATRTIEMLRHVIPALESSAAML